jgi:hypothetical protein
MATTQRYLGKLPRVFDNRIPSLHKMLRLAKAEPFTVPDKTTWRNAVTDWTMLGNDTCGDCVVATLLHAFQSWSANNGTFIVPDTDAAIANYQTLTALVNGVAYDPITKSGDTGLEPSLATNYWMTKGLAITAGGALEMLSGQADIDPADFNMVKRGIYEFGGIMTGTNLPLSADTEFEQNKPWADTTDTPGSLGGHEVWCIDYDADYFYVITWGKVQAVTHSWWLKYVDQCTTLLDHSWINSKSSIAPSNLNLTALHEQIVDLKGILGVY